MKIKYKGRIQTTQELYKTLHHKKKSKIGIEKINGTPSRELQRNHNHCQARTRDRETPSMEKHPSKSN